MSGKRFSIASASGGSLVYAAVDPSRQLLCSCLKDSRYTLVMALTAMTVIAVTTRDTTCSGCNKDGCGVG